MRVHRLRVYEVRRTRDAHHGEHHAARHVKEALALAAVLIFENTERVADRQLLLLLLHACVHMMMMMSDEFKLRLINKTNLIKILKT